MSNASSTADEILRCARTLILAGGYDGFSYADISKVVGIRNASIHHHFPRKSDLVRTLVPDIEKRRKRGLLYWSDESLIRLEQLRAYTGYWEACIADATAPFCVCALLADGPNSRSSGKRRARSASTFSSAIGVANLGPGAWRKARQHPTDRHG